MDSSIIAVRVANGTFVPILDTSGATRRRLVLTTIRDDQTSVRIDLYKGADEQMESPEYVGSLMIENIDPVAAGEADIALLLGIDEGGNLNATATDKKSGEYQSLSVGLESVEPDGSYDVPDFELSDEELTLENLSADEDELELDDSSALDLDDVSLEEDLTFDVESEPSTDTLAAGLEDMGELDESVSGEELAGLEGFSEEQISLDESFAEESMGEITESDDQFEAVSEEETEAEFSTLPDLDEEMIEADLGDEDFTFDEEPGEEPLEDVEFEEEAPELGDGMADELTVGAAAVAAATAATVAGTEDTEESDFDLSDDVFDSDLESSEFESDENLFDDSGLGEEDESLEESLDDSFADSVEETSDFDMEDEFDSMDSESLEQFESTEEAEVPTPSYRESTFGEEAEALTPRRSNPIIYVGYLILSLAALGVLTYLVFRLLEGPPAPPLRAFAPLAFLIPRGFGRRRRKGSVR